MSRNQKGAAAAADRRCGICWRWRSARSVLRNGDGPARGSGFCRRAKMERHHPRPPAGLGSRETGAAVARGLTDRRRGDDAAFTPDVRQTDGRHQDRGQEVGTGSPAGRLSEGQSRRGVRRLFGQGYTDEAGGRAVDRPRTRLPRAQPQMRPLRTRTGRQKGGRRNCVPRMRPSERPRETLPDLRWRSFFSGVADQMVPQTAASFRHGLLVYHLRTKQIGKVLHHH